MAYSIPSGPGDSPLGCTVLTAEEPRMNGVDDEYGLQVIAGCDVGPCPKVGRRKARAGHVIVQGAKITSSQQRAAIGHIPDHEEVVEIPEKVAIEYARKLRDEGLI